MNDLIGILFILKKGSKKIFSLLKSFVRNPLFAINSFGTNGTSSYGVLLWLQLRPPLVDGWIDSPRLVKVLVSRPTLDVVFHIGVLIDPIKPSTILFRFGSIPCCMCSSLA